MIAALPFTVAVLALLIEIAHAQAPDAIKVASFNILKGNRDAKTIEVIRASGADVVALQEADGAAPALATALGWHYREFSFDRGTEAGNSDNAILSRFPITQTLRHGVRVALAPDKESFVFCAHLRAYPYQPNDLRDGVIKGEAEAIRAAADARGGEIDVILDEMKPYIASGRAAFLTGDFNEPSHLDWTDAAAQTRLHALKVAWPTSSRVLAAGLEDSFRVARPDPLAHPGNTWTPRPQAMEVHDRIDFVYVANATVTEAKIIGEDARNADIVVADYPSDHRAVVSRLAASGDALKPLRTGVNLISNGGAESNPGAAAGADRVLTDWEVPDNNTIATAQLYQQKDGYAARFAGSGANYFYGGIGASNVASARDATQTIEIPQIPRARYHLAGHFGGSMDQEDSAALTATFLDGDGRELTSVRIGDVTAAERDKQTRLVRRSTRAAVPADARSVRFTLTFTKAPEGTSSDGAADNLSFVLTATKP